MSDHPAPLAKPLPFDIYLDTLRSAHNVGSILRTVEAFQLGAVHLGGYTPGLEHNQVLIASMGASDWVTVHRHTPLNELKRPLIAFETTLTATPLPQFSFPPEGTLIFGNEKYGCSETILTHADYIVSIPLFGRKSSLNVANAFAIVAAFLRLS